MNKSEKFWDLLSKIYDEEVKRFKQMYIKTVENTINYLNNNDYVLEIGCGTGTITNDIANNVKKIHAIDISSKMINIAKRKANKREIKNIEFKQSTIFDESYKKDSFDVILAFNVLHCIEDAEQAIKRIYELLKPEGFFISVTPSSGEKKKSFKSFLILIRHLIFLLTRIGIFPVPYVKFYKIPELEDSVVKGKFQITKTESFHTTEGHYFIVAKKI